MVEKLVAQMALKKMAWMMTELKKKEGKWDEMKVEKKAASMVSE